MYPITDHDRDTLPNQRPRAPTPSAFPPAFQYSSDSHAASSAYTPSTVSPPIHQLVHPSRARSHSASAGRPSTPPPLSVPPTTSAMAIDGYATDPYVVPTTPPRFPGLKNYPDPNHFPTPPTYPPVPGLVASGSTSTSTRSSAYTSPGGGPPLSSHDLSNVGLGLGKFANDDDPPYPVIDDEVVAHAITSDQVIPPRATSYSQSLPRESSEGSLSLSHTGAGAGSAAHHAWNDGPAHSTRSGSSSYEGMPPVPPRASYFLQFPTSLTPIFRRLGARHR